MVVNDWMEFAGCFIGLGVFAAAYFNWIEPQQRYWWIAIGIFMCVAYVGPALFPNNTIIIGTGIFLKISVAILIAKMLHNKKKWIDQQDD